MAKSIFQKHQSEELNKLYLKKNYQGANPNDAKILFVGRDPNWASDIETMRLFRYISEYLTDGVSFWNKYKIHHPFLLPNYKGDGKRYHKIFSKLNIESSFSNKISFVELIGFPTTGNAKSNNKLFLEYLTSDANRNHLIELDSFLNDIEKIIFIAWGLIDDLKYLNSKTGLFKKIVQMNKSKMSISELNKYENIFIHRHFSDAISNSTLDKMSIILKDNL
ncbi:hypothetical protein [Flavobacterium nitratireducens]|uniref:hypothetical protein n=1 Tax=Flavobacterium nitratireducens TaxID=992289 RepID=UPI002414FADD|nr:hypothetical protein [Flavobacterium nitratireducens]